MRRLKLIVVLIRPTMAKHAATTRRTRDGLTTFQGTLQIRHWLIMRRVHALGDRLQIWATKQLAVCIC